MIPPVTLGRKPHDPARVAAVPVRRVMAAASPPEKCLPPPDFVVELGFNDTLPTCCVVGLLNSVRLWCLSRHGFDVVYQRERLLTFYGLVAGCDPTESAIGATDGLMMLDVLETAQAKGFRINDQDVLVPRTFHRIETADPVALRQAIADAGSAYAGFDLRSVDLSVTGDWSGDVPGPVVGGHCAPPIGYDPTGFIEATWGTEKRCDLPWMLSRVEEAYEIEWAIAAA